MWFKAWTALQWLLNVAMSANPIGAIILAVMAVVAIVVLLIKHWEVINAWITKVTGGFVDIWDVLLFIMGPIGWIIIAVKKIWENWGMVSQVLVEVWEKVAGFFAGIGQYFAELWGGFEEKIAALGEYFVGIGEKIKGVFSGIGDFVAKIWEGLVAIIKSPFNLIIAGINMMIRGVNSISIDIPDWVPDAFGGGSTFGFDIPEIPSLQTEVGEGHEIAAGGMARVHGGESVGRFDFEPLRTELSDTNTKLDKMIGLLSNMPTTDAAAGWARKQKSATEGAFANR